MRSILVLMTAVLVVGVTAGAEPGRSGSWLTRWWPFGKSPQKKVEPPPGKSEQQTSSAEMPAALRAREQADCLRRVAVCDRLRAVAVQANDDELARKADQLEQRAWEVYRQRTAHLPAGGLDQHVLDRHLGADARLPTRNLDSTTSRALGLNRTPTREEER